jgi:hypothetical protein
VGLFWQPVDTAVKVVDFVGASLNVGVTYLAKGRHCPMGKSKNATDKLNIQVVEVPLQRQK